MPTKLQRISLSVEAELAKDLEYLAKKNNKSVAGFAKELILEALELREDLYLSKLANELDVEGAKIISNEEFWK